MANAGATDVERGSPLRWWVLGVMLTAEIMDLLDATVVNVAGPSLREDLGATATDLQWIIGGYTLALGAGLILGGRLGDRFGRRQMFLTALIAFTVLSLACALAPSTGPLIGLRLLQGFAGAMLLPQGLGLLRSAFPPAEIGKAFAVFGPVFGLGGILGPIIGGGIIQADLFGTGWRGVFLVNVPIGVVAAVIAYRVLPRTGRDPGIRIDLVGSVIVIAAAALLVLPLLEGRELGWPAWTYLSLALAVVGFVLFTVQQRGRVRRGRTPLVDPGIFTHRSFSVGLAGIALYFAAAVGAQLVLSLFLQIGERFSAGEAGVANIPLALGTGIGGAVSGAVLAGKLGRAAMQIGAALQIAGAAWLWFALGAASDFSIWTLVGGLVVSGVGSGIVIAGLFDLVLSSVLDREVGSASGVVSAVQSIASAAGVAAIGSAFFSGADVGDFAGGYRLALVLQVGLLVLFLVLSPLFPRRMRADVPVLDETRV